MKVAGLSLVQVMGTWGQDFFPYRVYTWGGGGDCVFIKTMAGVSDKRRRL